METINYPSSLPILWHPLANPCPWLNNNFPHNVFMDMVKEGLTNIFCPCLCRWPEFTFFWYKTKLKQKKNTDCINRNVSTMERSKQPFAGNNNYTFDGLSHLHLSSHGSNYLFRLLKLFSGNKSLAEIGKHKLKRMEGFVDFKNVSTFIVPWKATNHGCHEVCELREEKKNDDELLYELSDGWR